MILCENVASSFLEFNKAGGTISDHDGIGQSRNLVYLWATE